MAALIIRIGVLLKRSIRDVIAGFYDRDLNN